MTRSVLLSKSRGFTDGQWHRETLSSDPDISSDLCHDLRSLNLLGPRVSPLGTAPDIATPGARVQGRWASAHNSLSPQSMIWALSCSMSQENRAALPSSSSYFRSLTKCWRRERRAGVSATRRRGRRLTQAPLCSAASAAGVGCEDPESDLALTCLEHDHLPVLGHVWAPSSPCLGLDNTALQAK